MRSTGVGAQSTPVDAASSGADPPSPQGAGDEMPANLRSLVPNGGRLRLAWWGEDLSQIGPPDDFAAVLPAQGADAPGRGASDLRTLGAQHAAVAPGASAERRWSSYADRTPATATSWTPPPGRLMISVGCALMNARVSLAADGLRRRGRSASPTRPARPGRANGRRRPGRTPPIRGSPRSTTCIERPPDQPPRFADADVPAEVMEELEAGGERGGQPAVRRAR